jgi:hypothetical protein
MRIACWLLRATNTDSQNRKLIACSLQQWLHENYTYIVLYFHRMPLWVCHASNRSAHLSNSLGMHAT